ncbi:unnamed protein product [Effrenium voratum]|nr:unnamed protein product [Effrenium voratum]
MAEPKLLPIAPWLPARSRHGCCRRGLHHVLCVLGVILLLLYILVIGLLLLLLLLPRLLLQWLLSPALSSFGYVVEHGYALRICKLHVSILQFVQKSWNRRPYHSRFSDLRSELFPAGGGVCYVHPVPCLVDNFCYVLVHEVESAPENASNRSGLSAVVVDPCDAPAVEAALQHIAEQFYGPCGGLRLEAVLCTHKHWDHAGGNEQLAARAATAAKATREDSATDSEVDSTSSPLLQFSSPLKVAGGLEDDVPGCTYPVQHGDRIQAGSLFFEAVASPGHTLGSMMFRLACKDSPLATCDSKRTDALFTGDTLFSGGCGASFEGNQEDVEHCFATILEIWDPSTEMLLFPGHEYTAMILEQSLMNEISRAAMKPPGYFMQFCSAFYSASHRRGLHDALPTVPVTLEDERWINQHFDRALRRHARALVDAANQLELPEDTRSDGPLSVGLKASSFPRALTQNAPENVSRSDKSVYLMRNSLTPSQQLAVLYRADLEALRRDLLSGQLTTADAAERLLDIESRPFEASLLSGEGDRFGDGSLNAEEEDAVEEEVNGMARNSRRREEHNTPSDPNWDEEAVKDALKVLAVPAHVAVGPKVPCREDELPICLLRLESIFDRLQVPSRTTRALLALLQSDNSSSEEERQVRSCCRCCLDARSLLTSGADERLGPLVPLRCALLSLTPPNKRGQASCKFRCPKWHWPSWPCPRRAASSSGSSSESAQEEAEDAQPPPPPAKVLRHRRLKAVERHYSKHRPEGCPLCKSCFTAQPTLHSGEQ